jgi:hypothetical protein
MTLLLAMALSFAAAGCYHVRYVTDEVPGPPIRSNLPHFIAGLVRHHHFDLAQTCGDAGVARAYLRTTGLNGFLGFITLGIYTPTTLIVHCVDGATASLMLPPNETPDAMEVTP